MQKGRRGFLPGIAAATGFPAALSASSSDAVPSEQANQITAFGKTSDKLNGAVAVRLQRHGADTARMELAAVGPLIAYTGGCLAATRALGLATDFAWSDGLLQANLPIDGNAKKLEFDFHD